MVKQFENLTNEEMELLFKAPALVSVMSSCSYKNVNYFQHPSLLCLSTLYIHTCLYGYIVELLLCDIKGGIGSRLV